MHLKGLNIRDTKRIGNEGHSRRGPTKSQGRNDDAMSLLTAGALLSLADLEDDFLEASFFFLRKGKFLMVINFLST